MEVFYMHGLLMGSVVMVPLAARLNFYGHSSSYFSYPLHPEKEDLVDKFLGSVHKASPQVIVGHSMGGVIATRLHAELPKSVTHIVCLGSPIAGSSVAVEVARRSYGGVILSPVVVDMLSRPVEPVNPRIKVGMIAGTTSVLGVNKIFKAHSGVSDGAVQIEETRAPWLTDHTELVLGHTALIYNRQVPPVIQSFVQTGKFWPRSN